MAADESTAPERKQLVVVGVDGSAESVGALQWAAAYAGATGATLQAIHSWHYPGAVGGAPVGVAPESVTDEVRQRMVDTLAHAIAEGAPDVAVDQRLGYGHPAQVLVDASSEADLLVVGSRGHGAFTGMLVGSVSLHCVTHAHCPVVVVRRDALPQ
jgi:nucleotide-binding universal stress UspA family protein